MFRRTVVLLHGLLFVLLAGFALAQSGDYHVIAYKGDPPIVVDGVLDDWENVPNAIHLRDKAQVTFQPHYWTGPDDLSGTVHLAWRRGGL